MTNGNFLFYNVAGGSFHYCTPGLFSLNWKCCKIVPLWELALLHPIRRLLGPILLNWSLTCLQVSSISKRILIRMSLCRFLTKLCSLLSVRPVTIGSDSRTGPGVMHACRKKVTPVADCSVRFVPPVLVRLYKHRQSDACILSYLRS